MQTYLSRHIETALHLIHIYKRGEPFHLYLKKYFGQHKKHGSKDRKMITTICYSWLRLGKNLPDLAEEERLKVALFLTTVHLKAIENYFDVQWLEHYLRTPEEKFSFLQTIYSKLEPALLFPFQADLSPAINAHQWYFSFLHQPDVFIRIRPGYTQEIIQLLEQKAINFEQIKPGCLAFSSTTKIAELLPVDAKAVIQDISSQQTSALLELISKPVTGAPLKVWDCCAGSGGKSILATDIMRPIVLTVSDIRPTILKNLRQRFATAGIRPKQILQLDLTATALSLKGTFDLIICDAPCSGSGTWARTPENLSFFDEAKLAEFQELQCRILRQVLTRLNPGGHLLYLTCSVFEKENEAVVNNIQAQTSLELLSIKHFIGYPQKGDSMFGALFSLPK